jgi:hypothetical protein
MSQPLSYKEQVEKLINLQTMAKAVTALTTQTQDNKQKIMASIEILFKKIQMIIDGHKESGKKAVNACNVALEGADARQSAVIQDIMKNINSMANTKSLEDAIAKLQNDIDGLAGDSSSPTTPPTLNANAPAFVPASAKRTDGPMVTDSELAARTTKAQQGGYTYGKSRRREKGRRRRTKNSRKKGRGSKRR